MLILDRASFATVIEIQVGDGENRSLGSWVNFTRFPLQQIFIPYNLGDEICPSLLLAILLVVLTSCGRGSGQPSLPCQCIRIYSE